jgi:hypothetical protein
MQQHLSLGLLTTHLIQVRNWTVSTGTSVFTGLENVKSELINRRSRTSDQRIGLTPVLSCIDLIKVKVN